MEYSFFLSSGKQQEAGNHIHNLRKEYGTKLMNKESIMEKGVQYFTKLFKTPNLSKFRDIFLLVGTVLIEKRNIL